MEHEILKSYFQNSPAAQLAGRWTLTEMKTRYSSLCVTGPGAALSTTVPPWSTLLY